METITIPLSKRKITLLFIGSVLFVVAGVFFLMAPGRFLSPSVQDKPVIFIAGAAAILFFGVCAVVAAIKFFDNRPGIIIDKNGITDNSSGVNSGGISWKEITGISTAQLQNQRFILLMVNNPEKRIDAEPGNFKRRMMKINYRMYKTPVCINANALQCDFDELNKLLTDSYEYYKGK